MSDDTGSVGSAGTTSITKKTKRRRKWPIYLSIMITGLIAACCFLLYVFIFDEELLAWHDGDYNLNFSLYKVDLAAYPVYKLKVAGNQDTLYQTVSKKCSPTHIHFVRYKDWLLVADGKYIWGGYNYKTASIASRGSHELPFTVWQGGGTVVAEIKISDGQAEAPFNFEEIPEHGTTTKTGSAQSTATQDSKSRR